MAKVKDSTVPKEERKALKKAEKEKKRSDSDGVHKSKDKKEKKKERAALADKVANGVATGAVVVGEVEAETEIVKSDAEDENEHKKKKKMMMMTMRPVGALVPFANPLADEKVAKKVFKGVKKGMFQLSLNMWSGSFRALFVMSSWAFDEPNICCYAFCAFVEIRDIDLPLLFLYGSRSIEIPETWRQGSRQSASKIPHDTLFAPFRHSRPGRRHFPHGRHLAHSRPL
jgi:hypothetical protein